jgi:CBS domain-containing protein
MNIENLVTDEFETADPTDRASTLESTLRETDARGIVVVDEDGAYYGVVTPRQMSSSRVDPETKALRLAWRPATVGPRENVRTAARLMVGGRSDVLPVFEGEDLVGVVTVDDVLGGVQEFLGVLTVDDVFTEELVTIDPETSYGAALSAFRDNRVTHLPVVESSEVVGVVSLFDLLDVTTRSVERAAGGAAGGFDSHGGGGSHDGFRSHGGFGERAGDIDRLLDLPVRDVMSSPVRTTTRETALDEAVAEMLGTGISSLVVENEAGPLGIVTKTDVLRSLTWTGETHPPVQVKNVDLLDDISREDVVELVEDVTRKYGNLNLIEATVDLHRHDETLRGTPLILARLRLYTDKGHFVGTGEGYGASHAIHLALNVVERQLLEGKAQDETKKHPSEEYWSKVFGWWLTAPPRRRTTS